MRCAKGAFIYIYNVDTFGKGCARGVELISICLYMGGGGSKIMFSFCLINGRSLSQLKYLLTFSKIYEIWVDLSKVEKWLKWVYFCCLLTNFQLAKLENARSKINNLICHIHNSSQSSFVIRVDIKDESQSFYNLGLWTEPRWFECMCDVSWVGFVAWVVFTWLKNPH